MPGTIRAAGQALLASELYNTLAAKDAEMLQVRLAAIRNSGNNPSAEMEDENLGLQTSLADSENIRQGLAYQLKFVEERRIKLAAEVAMREAEAAKALAEKDALVLEWMHSNEAFKRLARQYGKKLGVTDEKRTEDYREEVLNVAEENPKFENTELNAELKRKKLNALKKA